MSPACALLSEWPWLATHSIPYVVNLLGNTIWMTKKKRSVLFSKCFVIVIDIYFTFWLPCAFVLVGSEVYKHFFFPQYQNRTTWPPLGLGFGPPCWASLLWPYAAQALFCKEEKISPCPGSLVRLGRFDLAWTDVQIYSNMVTVSQA